MADDPIRAYLDAKREFDQTKRNVEKMVAVVRDAGNKLGRCHDVSVSDVGVGFPVGRGASISGREWPDAKQLAETLADWHKQYNDLRNKYQAVPGADRSGLQAFPRYD